jgi:hypothetical protein
MGLRTNAEHVPKVTHHFEYEKAIETLKEIVGHARKGGVSHIKIS